MQEKQIDIKLVASTYARMARVKKELTTQYKQEVEPIDKTLGRLSEILVEYMKENNLKQVDGYNTDKIKAKPRNSTVIDYAAFYSMCLRKGRLKDLIRVSKPLIGKIQALFGKDELRGIMSIETNEYNSLEVVN